MMMNGIPSLDGHGKSSGDMNKAMERMSIVFKGRLSPDQLEAIKQDIQSTVMSPMAGDMLSAAGEGGDTMMAHMSPDMMGMAQEMGVLPDGGVNPMTGLPAFQGDNPGQDDPNEGGGGTGAGAGDPNASGGPADADLGATQAEVDTMNEISNVVETEKPMEFSRQYDLATKGMSTGDINAAGTFGVFSSIPSMQALAASKDKTGFVDAVMDARLSHDPSQAQLDVNNALDRGFRDRNPGIASLTGGLASIAGFISPALAAVNMATNINDTMAGYGLNSLMGTTTQGRPAGLAELQESLGVNVTQAAKDESDIQGSRDMDIAGGGIVDFMNFEPDPPEKQAGPETDPDLGVDAERAALLGMGYSPADATTIIENFGSLDTFKQRFEGRFGTEPTPGSIANPSAREFIQVPRGRPVGIGSLVT